MIPAQSSPCFEAWFLRHATGRLRSTFGALRLRGGEQVRRAAAAGPLLLLGNHTSWWDSLVALFLFRGHFDLRVSTMMNGKNLTKVPFFSRIGAFGVDLDDAADGARGLRYAARALRGPGDTVLMFPQGQERPVTVRPLNFRPGAAALGRLVPRATMLPFGLRYEMVDRLRGEQEAAVTKALDEIDAALCHGDDHDTFVPLFVTRSAGAELATRTLARLFAPPNPTPPIRPNHSTHPTRPHDALSLPPATGEDPPTAPKLRR